MFKPCSRFFSLCLLLLIFSIGYAQSPHKESKSEETPWVVPTPGSICSYERETDICLYDVDDKISVRVGFKMYSDLKVARVIIARKNFDEMNKKFVTQGIEPISEDINLYLAVARVLGKPDKSVKFEIQPIASETGKISRFNTKSGKVACAARMTYPTLDKDNFIYSVWLCRPSELN